MPIRRCGRRSCWSARAVNGGPIQMASVLIVIAARLINLPGLRLIISALLAIALIVILLRLLLLIDLRVIKRAVAPRRRIARAGVAAVGGINVIVVLRHVAAGGCGLRREIHGIA